VKKILFSTTSFQTIDNGPALFANLIYAYFKNSDSHDVRIFTEDLEDVNDSIKLYPLKLSENTFNKNFYQFLRMFEYYRTAKKIKQTFKFDILVYNNAFTGILSAIFSKKKVVVMVNDDNKMSITNQKFRFNKSYIKNSILYYFEKYSVRNADVILVNSNYMRAMVGNTYKISDEKVKVLFKGINLKNYRQKAAVKLINPINILFVKADYKSGGLFTLIDALEKLKEFKFKITIIGPPENRLNEIKNYLIENANVDYEVNGPMQPDLVREYFQRSDIFCVPSKKEALGVANMEALASGLPVISTNVGGIPEVLNYDKCGWLVEPDSPCKLAEAIKECILNPSMRLQKRNHGLEYVTKFDSEELFKNFLEKIN